ncbi:hypothetical protein GJ25_gp052 [Mycobacterium phage Hawkeye]|uniref:Uncharacterized protein n=1 Tax=Mycobacterium phage Hawkeye TaxID=1458711 RepID=X2KRI3_9CAUD|nr:hypothetical protein GJ25_gp052 [Mycobacterium phage Hawkeye]AHN84063.1 hypothetical protein PBI_HAWKEYE_52 [Mycobacterium phage Hawkeye]
MNVEIMASMRNARHHHHSAWKPRKEDR